MTNDTLADETVEAVARAMCVAEGGDPDRVSHFIKVPRGETPDLRHDRLWKNYETAARAAIVAMTRTPPTSTDERKDVLEEEVAIEAVLNLRSDRHSRFNYFKLGTGYETRQEAAEIIVRTVIEALTPNPTIDDHGGEDLRQALIRCGRAAGAFLADEVSSDFLTFVPAEVEARFSRYQAEVERLTEHLSEQITHVETRIQDGAEMGAAIWRIALEDVARENRAVLTTKGD